jgi:Fe-S-cluster containining protein
LKLLTRDIRLNKKIKRKKLINAKLDCNGCTACCKHDAISIHPELGDIAANYETEPHFLPSLAKDGVLMLKHKENCDCIYLGDKGCTIHGKAPAICREFDCRKLVKGLGYEKAYQMVNTGHLSEELLISALRLIPTLED